MSLKEDKAYEEAKNFEPPKPPEQFDLWKATRKYVYVGVACFVLGLIVSGVFYSNLKTRNRDLSAENKELKKTVKTIEQVPAETVLVPYTVLVPVTEAVEPVRDTAPVTDVLETEKPVLKTESPVTEEDDSDRIREITNPLTKIPPYKVKPPAPAQYTIYWLDVKRSDLAGMTADDFSFFLKYINKKYNTDDNVYFYVRLTDFPDIIMEFFIPNSMMDADIGISKEDTKDHCYRMEHDSCVMDFSDPSQIKLTGLKKDEYNLPTYDEDEVYYFSEFNEEMFSQIQKFQEHAQFLWG